MTKSAIFDFCEIFENHHQFESVREIKEWVICSMQTISMKCYDAKYRVKSENYIFSSSHVFYIALFQAILNWQIFANPENRGQVVFAY